jgi:hypothetical protein
MNCFFFRVFNDVARTGVVQLSTVVLSLGSLLCASSSAAAAEAAAASAAAAAAAAAVLAHRCSSFSKDSPSN